GHWSARAASLLLACHRMCWPVNGQVGIRRFRTSAIGSASDHYVGNLARATDGDGLRPQSIVAGMSAQDVWVAEMFGSERTRHQESRVEAAAQQAPVARYAPTFVTTL